MQKNLLLSLAILSCPLLHADNVKQLVKNVSEADLQTDMGELAEHVKNISMQDISQEKEEIEKKLLILQRLQWEKEIFEYKESNQRALESALIAEISGKDNAIQTKFNENVTENMKKAESNKKEESDHSVFWIWPTEATPGSRFGKINKGIADVKAKKDQINKERTNLVTHNKNDISDKLIEQLKHQRYIFASIYLAELKMCSEQSKGSRDYFTECLLQKQNKGNWQDVENPIFFKRFANDAYNATVDYALSKGICVSAADIEKSIQNKKDLAHMVESINALEKEAHAIRDKILYPQQESSIDLAGEHLEKSSIFAEDLKDDQNDQGALSQ